MAWLRNYLELKNKTGTYRFRVAIQDANIRGRLSLATHKRNLDGYDIAVRSTFRPRVIYGTIMIRPDDTTPWGTLSDLASLWDDVELEARGHGDANFWAATMMSDYDPIAIEPGDRYYYVALKLEQRQ